MTAMSERIPNRVASCAVVLWLFVAATSVNAAPTLTPPAGTTALFIDSDPSDYLGQGQRLLLTDADGTFTVIQDNGVLFIRFLGSSRDWDLVFLAPRGEVLLEKAYEGASNVASPRQPFIDIQGEHRFCSMLVGRFVVFEAAYTTDGDVQRLAIDFEVRCETYHPTFAGGIRIRSDIPLPAPRAPTPTPRPDDFVLWVYDASGEPRNSTMLTARRNKDYIASYLGPNRNHASISSDPNTTWRVIFGAADCSQLVPGVFDDAAPSPNSDLMRPDLWIARRSSDGLEHRCMRGADGRFVIHEAEWGEFGELLKFVADFEQVCTEGSIAFRGGVRYVSRLPTPVPRSPTPTPADYSSIAVMYSEIGDYVGSCGTQVLSMANGDFVAEYIKNSEPWRENTVQIVFDGGPPNSWVFRFQTADRGPLVPGHYPNAARWAFHDETEPGLSVSGQSRGCNRLDGEFTVHEAELTDDGTVLRFAADFVQYCEGFAPGRPKLYGTVRFRSSLPPPTLNPPHTPSPTPTPLPCPGDCDRNSESTVDELLHIVNLALGSRQVGPCRAADRSRDLRITVDEVAAAVQSALSGCDRAP